MSPNTTYQFRVVVSNEFGIYFGTNLSFTTPPGAPAVTTLAASSITATSAVLNATVDPHGLDTTPSFQIGFNTNYGATISGGVLAATNTPQPVSLPVSCEPGTVYFFRGVGANAGGQTLGNAQTFITPPAPVVATTLPATGITATNAILQGSAITGGLMTGYYYQYGSDTNYGLVTATNLLPPGARALRLNGVNQYVTTPKPINLNGASFTVEAWARRATTGSDDFLVLQGSGGVSNSSIHLGFRSDNTFTFGFWANDLNTTTTYTDTNWHHWAGTFNAATRARTLYRDGLAITNNTSPSLYLGTNAFLLGYSQAVNAYFGGDLAEVRVWSGERSQAQIAADMAATVLGNESGLLAAWRLNESSGLLAADATANANHGSTFFGPSWVATSVVPVAIGNLSPVSPVNFRLGAFNSLGASIGSNLTFTTLPLAPKVTTMPASLVGPSNATFNATVNPGGAIASVYFQYGLTTNYGLITTPDVLPAINSGLPYSNVVAGLNYNAVYNYRAVGSNSVGVVFGSNVTVTNPLYPPVATTLPATGIGQSSATIQGSVNPVGQPSRAYFQYGLTTSYGFFTPTNILPPSGTGLRFAPGSYLSTAGTINLSNSSFTVEVWARHTGSNTFELLLQHGASAIDNSALHFGWRAGNNFTFAFFNNDLNTGAVFVDTDWHHWAGTFNATNHARTLYRDGVFVTGDTSPSLYFGSGAITLARSAVNNTFYTGEMDEVRIYNYARSQAQIQAGMVNGFSTATGGELALWHMNEGSGGSTLDSSGFGHTASFSGSPVWVNPSLSQFISGLQPGGITYQFRLVATNASGIGLGPNLSFATAPLAPSPTTLPASSINTTSAVFNATVNPNGAVTRVWFQYGRTTTYGQTTTATNLPATNGIFSVNNLVTGLLPGTLYHCQVLASNSMGIVTGVNRWFTTPAAPPVALTRPGDGVTTNAAALHGVLNHNGSITRSYFEYGTDTNYGQFTATNIMRPIGAALRFNGTNQYVNINSALNLAVRSFTVEAWVRRASSNRLDLFFGHGTIQSANNALHLGFRANNVFTFAFWSNDLDTTNTYTDTGWHHWAGTFDSATRARTIYRDGVAVASDVSPSQYGNNTIVNLGYSQPAGTWFGGDLDEVHVWSTALTPAQIAGIMTTNAVGTEANLLACWRLDEGTGTFTGDVTQNGYHGNLVSSPTWLAPTNPPMEFLTGLQPATDYNYRLVAFNGVGFNYGSNVVFTTDSAAIVPPPPQLNLPVHLVDGSFQLSFTSVPGAPFSVLATTNLALPVAQWDLLGPATETPPNSGQFQFTDPQATNLTSRFYLLRSP